MDPNRYDQTLYNIRRDDAVRWSGEQDYDWESYYLFVASQDAVPDVKSEERVAVADMATTPLWAAHDDAHLAPDPLVQLSEPSVDFDLRIDRTLLYFPSRVECLTPDALHQTRAALAAFPLWRVAIYDADPADAIVIYPDRVQMGRLPPAMPLDFALAEWLPQAVMREQRTPRVSTLRRQLWHLRPRMACALNQVTETAAVFLAAFDHERSYGKPDRFRTWFLQRAKPEETSLRCVQRNMRLARGDYFPVDEFEGTIGNRGGTSADNLYLTEWSFPPLIPFEYVFESNGHAQPGVIRREDIVDDHARFAAESFWPFRDT